MFRNTASGSPLSHQHGRSNAATPSCLLGRYALCNSAHLLVSHKCVNFPAILGSEQPSEAGGEKKGEEGRIEAASVGLSLFHCAVSPTSPCSPFSMYAATTKHQGIVRHGPHIPRTWHSSRSFRRRGPGSAPKSFTAVSRHWCRRVGSRLGVDRRKRVASPCAFWYIQRNFGLGDPPLLLNFLLRLFWLSYKPLSRSLSQFCRDLILLLAPAHANLFALNKNQTKYVLQTEKSKEIIRLQPLVSCPLLLLTVGPNNSALTSVFRPTPTTYTAVRAHTPSFFLFFVNTGKQARLSTLLGYPHPFLDTNHERERKDTGKGSTHANDTILPPQTTQTTDSR